MAKDTRQTKYMQSVDAKVPEHIRNEPDWEKLEEHLFQKTRDELGRISSGPHAYSKEALAHADDFYTGGASHALGYLHQHHGIHPVHAAVMLGYTSPNLQPDLNFDVTDRMLEAGKGDIAQIPPTNEPKFSEFVGRHLANGMLFGNKLDTGEHGIKWFEKNGAKLEGPARDHAYYGAEGRWDGKHVHYILKSYSKGALAKLKGRKGVLVKDKKIWVPISNAAKKADISEGLDYAKIPLYSKDPKLSRYAEQALTPSNWSSRGNVIRNSMMLHQNLIRHMGHDESAEWLSSLHPYDHIVETAFRAYGHEGEIPKTVKGKKQLARKMGFKLPDKGYFDLVEPDGFPGAALFGPKIGSYVKNLTGDHRYLTIDLWHSRNQAKHIGRSATMSDPEKDKIRRVMYRVLKRAADHHGLTVSQAQSRLWHHEQHEHLVNGIPLDPASYRDGVDMAQARKGQQIVPRRERIRKKSEEDIDSDAE